MNETVLNLLGTAFTHDLGKVAQKLRNGNSVLCHYTSAENALNILKSEEFWLRNASCMNDYTEVTNGIKLVDQVLKDNDSTLLNRMLSMFGEKGSDISASFVHRWDEWIQRQSWQVFIGCLSECSADDKSGKLSMWRAYGSNSGGVCFQFNIEPFLAETNALGVYSMPVTYYTHDQFSSFIENAVATLENQSGMLRRAKASEHIDKILAFLIFRSVSLKHPGFVEEQEFRLIHLAGTPTSKHVNQETASIGGIPQIVQKIALRDDPENGLHRADIKSIIRRIIIGPSNYPKAVETALVQQLLDLGVEDAADKVVVSGIPLRLS